MFDDRIGGTLRNLQVSRNILHAPQIIWALLQPFQNSMNGFLNHLGNLRASASQFDEQRQRLQKQYANIQRLRQTWQQQEKALSQAVLRRQRLQERLSQARRDARNTAANSAERRELERLLLVQQRYQGFIERARQTQRQRIQDIKRLNQSLRQQRSLLIQQRQALRNAGMSLQEITAAEQRLGKQLEQNRQRLHHRTRLFQALNDAGRMISKGAYIISNSAILGAAISAIGQSTLHNLMRLSGAMRGFVHTASQFEDLEAVLRTLEGSADQAKKSLDWVSEFAVKTPYELQEVAEAFVRLKSYGLEPTNGLLKTLGDTSAAMGKPLMQAVEAIADAITGENERLKEFGIKASKGGGMIQYSYTDSQGVQKMAKALANDRKAIEAVLTQIWHEKYGGAMQARSETFSGTLSNLRDQWTRFQKMVMEQDVFRSMTERLKALLAKIDEMAENGELQAWAKDVALIFQAAVDAIWAIGKALAAGIKSFTPWIQKNREFLAGLMKWFVLGSAALTVLAPFSIAIGTIMGSFLMLSSAVKAVGAALLFLGRMAWANPILLAIGALVAAGTLLWQHWETVSETLGNIWSFIGDLIQKAVHEILSLLNDLKEGAMGIVRGIGEAFQNLKNALGELKEKAGNLYEKASGKALNLYEKGIDAFSNGIEHTVNFFKGDETALQTAPPLSNHSKKTEIHQAHHYNIHVQAQGDGQEIARAVSSALRQQQREQEALAARNYYGYA